MSAKSRPLVADSLAPNRPWIFLSPHLDDAVLSCGALIEAVSRTREVVVASIFTESGPGPYTRAARSFLRQCSSPQADSLFEARRQEDAAVLASLGVGHLHFGAVDALFRKRERLTAGAAFMGRRVPELVHRYPTYRFDIALGRVSRGDTALTLQLQRRVALLIEETGAELLFCPVGVGMHVDHLIARKVGESLPQKAVFYSDFPYNQNHEADKVFVDRRGLTPWLWEDRLPAKHKLVRQYATQANALFPDGSIPVSAESYYVPASARRALEKGTGRPAISAPSKD